MLRRVFAMFLAICVFSLGLVVTPFDVKEVHAVTIPGDITPYDGSFVDLYSKLSKRVKEEVIHAITPEQMHHIAAAFSEISREHGIKLRACSETIDLSADGVQPAACISKDTIEQVCGRAIAAKKDKSQRPECGCIQSVDVGAYNTCKNGCIYCYANHSENSINNNLMKHNPYSDILIGTVDKNEKIITRKY